MLSVKKMLAASVLLIAFTISLNAEANSPLPSFFDQGLRACFDEHVQQYNWQYAEDVDYLACSNRDIRDAMGLFLLNNLETLDLSDNPIEWVDLYPLHGPSKLKKINLSRTGIFDFQFLGEHRNLKEIYLNNLLPNPWGEEIYLPTSIFQNNPGITHLGLNGIDLQARPELGWSFYSLQLESLEISGTGWTDMLFPVDRFHFLRKLDLSNNQFEYLGVLPPFLEELNLNSTSVNVYDLWGYENLKRLSLAHPAGVTHDLDVLAEIVRQKPNLTHLNLSGIQIGSHWPIYWAINDRPQGLIHLALANTQLEPGAIAPHVLDQLRYLDISDNGLPYFDGFGLRNMKHLDLSNNQLMDINGLLYQSYEQLEAISLYGNNNLRCFELDQLATQLNSDVEFTRPAMCI